MKGKKYHVRLTEAEKKRLLEITKKGKHPVRQIIRANILLHREEGGTARTIPEQEEIAKQCGCQVALVYQVSKQYEREEIDRVLNRKVRETPPIASVVTGEVEAKIIALCCGEPPGAVKEVSSAERPSWTGPHTTVPGMSEKTKKEPDGIPTEPSGCYSGHMENLPAKEYSGLCAMNQLNLPMDVGVLIPPNDSVRLVVLVLEQLDVQPLYEAYDAYCERRRREAAARERQAAERGAGELVTADAAEGTDRQPGRGREKKKDGRPPCDILAVLRIILYAYMEGIYSSRGMAKACRRNINFMWLLNGNPPPSHGMLNTFRKHILGTAIEKLFYDLGRCGEVTLGNCFIDGTMLEAQANRHKAVWRKSLDRYEQGQRDKALRIARAINEQAGAGLSEDAQQVEETAKLLREYVNNALEGAEGNIPRRTLKEYRKELKECVKKLEKYRKQREIMGIRNSYSKTDTDATFMRMKDETLQAAYNVQAAVEGEYITGAGVFANPNDGTTLKPFLERLKLMLGNVYEKVTADAGYESEENYAYLAEHNQQAYIKPANYEQRKTKKFREDISKRENMAYDRIRDEYTCANNRKLRATGTETRVSKSGYESTVTVYESEGCEGCPVRERCTASSKNRRMEVSGKLLAFRSESEANIKSDEGILLRVNRSIQVEGAFGVAKEDHHFRRFFTRGKAGVSCELFLVCFGYNVNEPPRRKRRGIM
jgi:transposase